MDDKSRDGAPYGGGRFDGGGGGEGGGSKRVSRGLVGVNAREIARGFARPTTMFYGTESYCCSNFRVTAPGLGFLSRSSKPARGFSPPPPPSSSPCRCRRHRRSGSEDRAYKNSLLVSALLPPSLPLSLDALSLAPLPRYGVHGNALCSLLEANPSSFARRCRSQRHFNS